MGRAPGPARRAPPMANPVKGIDLALKMKQTNMIEPLWERIAAINTEALGEQVISLRTDPAPRHPATEKPPVNVRAGLAAVDAKINPSELLISGVFRTRPLH